MTNGLDGWTFNKSKVSFCNQTHSQMSGRFSFCGHQNEKYNAANMVCAWPLQHMLCVFSRASHTLCTRSGKATTQVTEIIRARRTFDILMRFTNDFFRFECQPTCLLLFLPPVLSRVIIVCSTLNEHRIYLYDQNINSVQTHVCADLLVSYTH